jgi:hypothetical protein
VHSFLRFVFVVVPTAVLATAVVVGVSRPERTVAVVADGDLQRDLQLASASSIELAPIGEALATVSAIEAPTWARRHRTLRPKRATSGPRIARSRARAVRAAPEPRPADVAEEPAAETTELAGVEPEATAEATAPGGVALPRPTAIPVSFPPPGTSDTYDPGSVIRGGDVDPDHCQIGRRRPRRSPVYGPTIFRGPQGPRAAGRDRERWGIRDRDRVSSTGTRWGILGPARRRSERDR